MTVFGETILIKHSTYQQVIWNVMPTVHYHGLLLEKEKVVEARLSMQVDKNTLKSTKRSKTSSRNKRNFVRH